MKNLKILVLVLLTGALLWALGVFRTAEDPGEAPIPATPHPPRQLEGQTATGTVFHDRNGNGLRDAGEEGLAGVGVSDQRSVVLTDQDGRWELPAWDRAVYFVLKPRDYMTPVSEQNVPRFYHLHNERGELDVEGPTVPVTGPLPASMDFPLVVRPEPDSFQVVFMGDPQPESLTEVEYLAHDVAEELVGTRAAFLVTLGDITHNDPGLYPFINGALGMAGVPVYNTHGNHDANYDAPDNYDHWESWRATYGPRYYAFDHGPVHFIVLSDVIFPVQGRRYETGLGADQLHWLEEDLAHVPRDRMVVLSMHIPLTRVEMAPDFGRLYELLTDRPHTVSFSGHEHTLSHLFLGEGQGWEGAEPHHHIVAGSTGGMWWNGALDETEIPHATSADGTPNGYFVVTFHGTGYSTRFKAVRRPADYQMQIHAPEEVTAEAAADTPVLVNVFNGNERTTVQMSVDEGGEWAALERTSQVDPLYARVAHRESGESPVRSTHIWEGTLPPDLGPGSHLIRIRVVDMHGQEWAGSRIFRVTEGGSS